MQEFPRAVAVRKPTSVRSLLGEKTSDQLVSQRVTTDRGKILAVPYRGFFFSPTSRNSGSPTFTARHVLQSTLHAQPGR